MFYVKTRCPSGKTVRTDITDENVFTRCPICARELNVDLTEFLSDGEGDLFSNIVCSSCTAKRAKKHRHTDGIKITNDGLELLSDTLCQAGYGEQVYALFDRFDVESVIELLPDQYEAFAGALTELAVEGG